jgi:hypothetical protein
LWRCSSRMGKRWKALVKSNVKYTTAFANFLKISLILGKGNQSSFKYLLIWRGSKHGRLSVYLPVLSFLGARV